MANYCVALTLTVFGLLAGTCNAVELRYASSPLDNPLRGLVPYVDADGRDQFPCSLEFRYFAFSDLMRSNDPADGSARFDWTAIEETLDETSARGNQLVMRIYLEMPSKKNGVPRFLVDQGLKKNCTTSLWGKVPGIRRLSPMTFLVLPSGYCPKRKVQLQDA